MKLTNQHSFPDADVLEWRLTGSDLYLRITDVFYDGKLRGESQLQFPLLRPASAMQYDHKTNQWTDCSVVEPLKNLPEFHFKRGFVYSLKGFGQETGHWIAICIHSEFADISWARLSVE